MILPILRGTKIFSWYSHAGNIKSPLKEIEERERGQVNNTPTTNFISIGEPVDPLITARNDRDNRTQVVSAERFYMKMNVQRPISNLERSVNCMPRKKAKDEAADELSFEFYVTSTRKVCKANRGILHMGTKVVYTLYRRLGCAGANVG